MSRKLLVTSLLFLLISCNNKPNSSSSLSPITSSSSRIPDYVSYDVEDKVANNDVYEELFDINNKIRFQINITQKQLTYINNDYLSYASFSSKSPIYRLCNLSIFINETEYFYNEVGIRMKGNTSRREFLDDTGNIINLIHYKLSFDETFDDKRVYRQTKVWENEDLRAERKARTFAGLEKLDLKWNKNFDSTYIKEYFSYQTFNDYKVLAPLSNLAQMTIRIGDNKVENLGVFSILETIDSNFINHHFDTSSQGGDLYKVGWGNTGCNGGSLTSSNANCMGIENEVANFFPTYDLKTNKTTSSHDDLINLINVLNNNSTSQLETLLSDYLDVDSFLRYEAVAHFLGNPDDMRNNDNNYYLYFSKDTHKACIIPFDFDRTLGINKDWNPTRNSMIDFDPYNIYKGAASGWPIDNPIYLKTFIHGGSEIYATIYKGYLNEIISNDYFNVNKFNQIHEIVKRNYQDVIVPTITSISSMYAPFTLNENPNNIVNTNVNNLNYDYYINNKISSTLQQIDNW